MAPARLGPVYLETLERDARHPFYGVLAAIARRALDADRAAVEGLLAAVDWSIMRS